jgi:hypothetical protein
MERDPMQCDAAGAQRLRDRLRKVQACGRRRDGALRAREHGLIVGAVMLVGRTATGDVGRQRHVATLGQRLVEHGAVKREGERDFTTLPFGFDRGVE